MTRYWHFGCVADARDAEDLVEVLYTGSRGLKERFRGFGRPVRNLRPVLKDRLCNLDESGNRTALWGSVVVHLPLDRIKGVPIKRLPSQGLWCRVLLCQYYTRRVVR